MATRGWKAIPVLVLTASAVHRAVLQAEDFRIDGFMTKPVSLDQFLQAVKSLRRSRLIEIVLPPWMVPRLARCRAVMSREDVPFPQQTCLPADHRYMVFGRAVGWRDVGDGRV